MTLHEIRVSEIQPGDEWLLDGAWVQVLTVDITHPDDHVGIDYTLGQPDDEIDFTNPWGTEVAVVKRAALNTIDLVYMAARELIEAYDAPFLAFGDWADRLEEKIDALRELIRDPESARPREWHDHDCGGTYGDKPHWHYT
jgi:hypothetical protein